MLPIDAKFPREQVLALFETNDPNALDQARVEFERVMKEQAKRIAGYIRPEAGTTDMALMYLPSETLYMEAVLNAELSDWLNKRRVYPVYAEHADRHAAVDPDGFQMEYEGTERATEECRKRRTHSGISRISSSAGESLSRRTRSSREGSLTRLSQSRDEARGEQAPLEFPAADELRNPSGSAARFKETPASAA